jgi:copper ion binding protein
VAARTVTVPVEGMICQICAGRVKSTLKDIRGVDEVDVSLEKRHAVVRYDAETVTPDELARAIKKLGYKAAPRVSQ